MIIRQIFLVNRIPAVGATYHRFLTTIRHSVAGEGRGSHYEEGGWKMLRTAALYIALPAVIVAHVSWMMPREGEDQHALPEYIKYDQECDAYNM